MSRTKGVNGKGGSRLHVWRGMTASPTQWRYSLGAICPRAARLSHDSSRLHGATLIGTHRSKGDRGPVPVPAPVYRVAGAGAGRCLPAPVPVPVPRHAAEGPVAVCLALGAYPHTYVPHICTHDGIKHDTFRISNFAFRSRARQTKSLAERSPWPCGIAFRLRRQNLSRCRYVT